MGLHELIAGLVIFIFGTFSIFLIKLAIAIIKLSPEEYEKLRVACKDQKSWQRFWRER